MSRDRGRARAASRRLPLLLAVLLLPLPACDRSPEAGDARHAGAVDTAGLRGLPVPGGLERGRDLYGASCRECHGEAALGTNRGPPLVHAVYEPAHHADAAFVLAVERGVRAHHWRFGDMPPRPDVSRDEVMEIVRYVRWLQREAGVY